MQNPKSLSHPKIESIPEADLLMLHTELDRLLNNGNGTVVLAIDGGSASGKTTLAACLEQKYKCTVFHTDDFFLRPEQRTPERFATPGGNMDRERFLQEVLLPLREGKNINYRRYDCSTSTILPSVTITPERLCIIEGAYSMHPELSKYYDFSVFLEATPQLRKKRIQHRNTPQSAKNFFEKWIPLEQKYFEHFKICEQCSMHIKISE